MILIVHDISLVYNYEFVSSQIIFLNNLTQITWLVSNQNLS